MTTALDSIYKRQRDRQWLAKGLCPRCAKHPPLVSGDRCRDCREANVQRMKERRNRAQP